MLSATASPHRSSNSVPVATADRGACTEIFVVSEDEPGQWRVADRLNDCVSGPFSDEDAALGLAFNRVRFSRRWEIHVLDQFCTLMSSYNSEEDARSDQRHPEQ